MVQLSAESRTLAGILLLSLVAVQYGGVFLLKIVRGRQPVTEMQRSFFRAGHAHAGVFLVLGLVAQLLVDSSGLDGVPEMLARQGIPAAALLVPGGFFLSVARPGAEKPGRLIVLLYLGIASLTVGLIALGLGLITA